MQKYRFLERSGAYLSRTRAALNPSAGRNDIHDAEGNEHGQGDEDQHERGLHQKHRPHHLLPLRHDSNVEDGEHRCTEATKVHVRIELHYEVVAPNVLRVCGISRVGFGPASGSEDAAKEDAAHIDRPAMQGG